MLKSIDISDKWEEFHHDVLHH